MGNQGFDSKKLEETVKFWVKEDRYGFVLNTSREHLAIASGFDESADLGNPRWAEGVCRYFGQQPYSTIGGQMESPTMGQPMKEEKSEEEYMEP